MQRASRSKQIYLWLASHYEQTETSLCSEPELGTEAGTISEPPQKPPTQEKHMLNQNIRTSVRTLYDMQKLRIQFGNRIFAAFRVKLDLKSSDAEKSNDEASKLLEALRKDYRRITDGVKKITRKIETKLDAEQLITTYGELAMIQSYDEQIRLEKAHEKAIDYELSKLPIYNQFLANVHGCGVLMSGVILSEIDIHACNSISALWKYAGLDVVVKTDHETGEITEEGRSKKRHHLEPKTYTDSDGKQTETVGITFNPFLKTKLIGVLGSSFIKLGGPYRDIYDNYKHRLENNPKHADKTKLHRHNMAVRYMIKEFLADLWTEWRTLEGLPVRARYNEEKLGIVHSKAA